jgi:hypothetical protein
VRSRPQVLVCAALVAAAALLWGASSTGVALLALAGVAGVVATGGVVRRTVGALLGLAGIAAAVMAGSWLAVAGGAVLLVAGAFVLVREPLLPRYGAGGDRRADVDPDRAAWQELDAGRDPTADGPSRQDDPGGRPPDGAG